LKDLISGILRKDPLKRLDIESICSHKWFSTNIPTTKVEFDEKFRNTPGTDIPDEQKSNNNNFSTHNLQFPINRGASRNRLVNSFSD